MTKRLFLAVPFQKLDGKFVDYAKEKKFPGFRFVDPINLHLTLVFLGETSEEVIPHLVAEVRKVVASIDSFDLRVERVTLAPPGRTPTLFWLLFQPRQEWFDFVERLQRVASNIIPTFKPFPSERQVPHMTLARFKSETIPPKLWTDVVYGEDDVYQVSRCQLMESVLNGDGPKYTSLATFSLRHGS